MSYVAEPYDPRTLYEGFGWRYTALPYPDIEALTQVFGENFKRTAIGTEMLMPLSLRIPGKDWFDFPIEPIISFKGGHDIIKRKPIKAVTGGTLKERWAENDYEIKVKGALVDLEGEDLPKDFLRQLKEICTYKGNIEIKHYLVNLFDIQYVAIDDYDIDETIATNAQKYRIDMCSDLLFDALLTNAVL